MRRSQTPGSVLIPKKRRKCTVIKLSDLPSICRTDSTLCGYFLSEFCLLREVIRNGGVIKSC